MNESIEKLKIVLIGARQPDISGSTLVFREIERSLSSNPTFKIEVVDLSYIRGNGIKGLLRYASKMIAAYRYARSADALLLFTIGSGLPWTLPPFKVITWVTRTELIIRCTGGTAHSHGSRFRQWFVRQMLSGSKLFMVETDLLVKHAHSVELKQTVSTPNGRHLDRMVRHEHQYSGRWVMISRFLPSVSSASGRSFPGSE